MNIFYLDSDPKIAAQYHISKHVVKMIIEVIQLLSSAHRILDGDKSTKSHLLPGEDLIYQDIVTKTGRQKNKAFVVNKVCTSLSHQSHPSAIWLRESKEQYLWGYRLLEELHLEKIYRYGTGHQTFHTYGKFLSNLPKNIESKGFKQPPQAMHERYKCDDSIEAYRKYYVGEKYRFSKWKNREIPSWFHPLAEKLWLEDPIDAEGFNRYEYIKVFSSKTDVRVTL